MDPFSGEFVSDLRQQIADLKAENDDSENLNQVLNCRNDDLSNEILKL